MKRAILLTAVYEYDSEIKVYAAFIIVPQNDTTPLESIVVQHLPPNSTIFDYHTTEIEDETLKRLAAVALMKGLIQQ